MRNNLLLLLFIMAFGVASHPLAAQRAYDGYYFPRYHVDVVVHPDNSYSVEEQMDVMFLQQSHGLYRTISTDVWINRDISEAQDGSQTRRFNYHPSIDNIRVSAECKVFDADGCKDIRIGSADHYVEGLQHYNLSYTMRVPDDRVEQSDLFFFSLLGTANACTTVDFSYRVTFEKPLPEGALSKLQVFTGELGSRQECIQGEAQYLTATNTIEGSLTNVEPYSAVTVYLPLPQGYFETDTPTVVYVAWFFAVVAILLLLIVLRRELTAENSVTPVVSFYPPNKISSADVGTIIDCEVDDRDLISLIPYFANAGYLRIEKRGENRVVLVKQCDIPDDAPNYQRTFFTALFRHENVFDPNHDSSQKFGNSWLTAKNELERSFRGLLNERDSSSFKILLFALLFVGIALACGTAVRGSLYFGFCAMLCLAFEAVVLYFGFADKGDLKSGIVVLPIVAAPFIYFSGLLPQGLLNFIREVVYGAMELDYMGGATFTEALRDLYVPLWLYVGLLVLAIVVCYMSARLTKMTYYRREHLGELLGLQEFIRTAEKDRLQMLLTEDGRYFYNVLPYAVAFGLAGKWADKFNGLIFNPNDGYDSNIDYYTLGRILDLVNTPHFNHGIMAEQRARAEAAAKAARSAAGSGSSWGSSGRFGGGGGGYSGGGFGGGGSRRW